MDNRTPELNKAFAEARAEIKNPSFDSTNPHYKSKFASLQSVMNATIPVLARHGITVHQDLQTVEGGVGCYTHLCHTSGEEKVYGPLVIPFTKHDAQGYASASTYARRYHLMGVLGVVGDNDDDAETLRKNPPDKEMSEDKAKKIAALIDEANPESGEGVCAFGEAWIGMDQEEQKAFGRWIGNFYPGRVSATKAKMHAILAEYRKGRNAEEEAA